MKKKYFFLTLFFAIQLFYAQNKNEQTALNWLNQNKKVFEIQPSHELKMLFSRKGPSGETFRYYQFVNGVQVFDASIAIHVSKRTGKVTYHASTYDKNVTSINTTPSISKDDALNIVKNKLNITKLNHLESKLYIYNKTNNTHLVYRIVTRSDNLIGAWETIVDANNGGVLSSKDISFYYDKKKEFAKNTNSTVSGSAMVYDPDPLTATLSIYGGQYADNNDATNASLDAARTNVNLIEIEQTGSSYKLKGTYSEIAELEAPATGLFIQNSPNFNFNRNQQGFEAVNVYYHTDKSIRYINETLGINLVSLYNGGVLRFDPHAANGADQSYYTGGTLNFGEGGVDDGEDQDVILHELAHGLHDWVTNSSSSQVDGLGEGNGDYWASSYKRSLGQWTSSDTSYYYVFGWDGHNEYWNGRISNTTRLYPGGLVGQIHSDGEIWSTVLMEIWEVVGRENMDKAFLEGLAMTNSNTNQPNAAIAVRQAAIDMGFSCSDINYMTDRFEARGYTLPTYNCSDYALDLAVNASVTSPSCGDNTVNPTITLTNVGTTTITSATINWNFDNGVNTTINWTGSLAQNNTVDISVGNNTFSSGSHTFNVTISNPNGNTDQGTANNTTTETFDIAIAYNTTQIHLDLLTDDYCEETTWTFKDANGTILYSGGPYTQNQQDNTHFIEDFNVPTNQCYTFEIIDSQGDGICCGYGNGSYTLTTDDNTVITTNGDFGDNKITEIAIDNTASINDELAKNITVYPNPTNNNLNVNLNNITGTFNYNIYNTLGQEVLKGNLLNTNTIINVSKVEKGIYFLKIKELNSDNKLIKKIIIN